MVTAAATDHQLARKEETEWLRQSIPARRLRRLHPECSETSASRRRRSERLGAPSPRPHDARESEGRARRLHGIALRERSVQSATFQAWFCPSSGFRRPLPLPALHPPAASLHVTSGGHAQRRRLAERRRPYVQSAPSDRPHRTAQRSHRDGAQIRTSGVSPLPGGSENAASRWGDV